MCELELRLKITTTKHVYSRSVIKTIPFSQTLHVADHFVRMQDQLRRQRHIYLVSEVVLTCPKRQRIVA